MNEQGSLIVGLEFGSDYIQLCFFNHKSYEVESISATGNELDYLIPNVMAVSEDTKEWLIGKDAIDIVKENKGQSIDHIFEKVKAGTSISVYGMRIEPVELVEKLLRKILLILKREFPVDMIRYLTITMEDDDQKLIDVMYQALTLLGIEKDRAQIIGYDQSYMYYAMSQNRELWMNDVGLFYYGKDGLFYHELHIDRKTMPMLVKVMTTDCSDTVYYDLVKKDKEQLPFIFMNVANSILHKKIVSTIYLVGQGFDSDWTKECLEKLCIGRRVFKGNNLYAHGACYASRTMCEENKFTQYLFMTKDMVKSNITMNVYQNGKDRQMEIISAGQNWYQISENFHVILDDVNEIPFTITNILTQEKHAIMIPVEISKKRSERMTRLNIRVRCLNAESCVISIKDLGFGEYAPATNQIWEHIVTI